MDGVSPPSNRTGCTRDSTTTAHPPGSRPSNGSRPRACAAVARARAGSIGGGGLGSQLAQPGDDVVLLGTPAAGGVKRCALRVVRLPVEIRAARQQVQRGAALAG